MTDGLPSYDVTLLTEARFPDLAPDDRLLRAALERRGARVRVGIWTDASVDWSISPLTVVRSTSDYFHHYERWQAWLDLAERETRLINSPRTIRWNMHKRYLGDLEGRGIAIVPTLFVERGARADLPAMLRERDWTDVVVKPCVSGSSVGARRFSLDAPDAAQSHLDALADECDVMIQPYLHAVEHERERSLVFLGGEFVHAIRKAPFTTLAGSAEELELPHDPPQPELDFARRVLASLDEMPLYARIDMVPADSQPRLMELELIEPALYFAQSPGAADRFAELLLGDGLY